MDIYDYLKILIKKNAYNQARPSDDELTVIIWDAVTHLSLKRYNHLKESDRELSLLNDISSVIYSFMRKLAIVNPSLALQNIEVLDIIDDYKIKTFLYSLFLKCCISTDSISTALIIKSKIILDLEKTQNSNELFVFNESLIQNVCEYSIYSNNPALIFDIFKYIKSEEYKKYVADLSYRIFNIDIRI